MSCAICGNEKPPYKCPQCIQPFCSVRCSREHKKACTGKPSETETEPQTPAPPPKEEELSPIDAKCEQLWQDERIRELVKYEGVSKLLRLIVEISESPKLSGEQSSEGRQLVALKKIRELRKGGREANAAVEELVTIVNSLWEQS